MTFVSYAQNFEDVLLWRALQDVEHGRYLDVGAQDPVIDSVSLAFYEAGWRGIHVEPTSFYAGLLREARPDEIVIEAAVTDAAGPIPFYELGGLSSGIEEIAKHHKQSGHQPRRTLVPTVGLDNLLELRDGDIHWLKIDVEGMEADVLRSWRESRRRPWILVVESTYPNSEKPTQHLWIHEVLRRGYQEVFFDGLSRYFLHESHCELVDRLNRPANVFDAHQITLQHFSAKLAREEAASRQQAAESNETQRAAQLLELRERMREAVLGLDKERAAHASLRTKAAAELEEAQARLEGAETALAADRARLDELAARQHESAAEVARLGADLTSEREAKNELDSEILKIAKLAGAELDDLSSFAPRRSIPSGAAFAAVKSRLHLATKELELLGEHAERQYAAGHQARDTEVNFLNERILVLQAEIAEVHGRLAQFEAAYAAVRDRSESAEKEKVRLQLLLDEQNRALEAVRDDAAELHRRLAESRQQVASLYASRGGKLASLFGLLPKAGGKAGSAPPIPGAQPASTEHDQTTQGGSAAPQPRTEIAVNDVRHVTSLLALNGATFVDALYRTFLKRAPDRSGREHFVGRLQAGHGKEAVLLAIATSKEAQAIGAPIEGVSDLQRAQARKGGWFSSRDRALEERLNRLEYGMGEAHNGFIDRLDRIQNSVDQIQTAISVGGGFRSDSAAASATGGHNGVRHSIKQGISIAPPASAPEFIDSLKREVQSSSEALSLRRS